MVETKKASKNGKKAAVITLSDKGYAGEREDKSGPLVKKMLEELGYEVGHVIILPDERKQIEQELIRLCDEVKEVDVPLFCLIWREIARQLFAKKHRAYGIFKWDLPRFRYIRIWIGVENNVEAVHKYINSA